MLIKAAINGGRTKAEHSAVPVTPDEQAADVVACINAGADAIHLHVRSVSAASDSEKESLNAKDVAQTIEAVRSACQKAEIPKPKSLVGVSTGAWIVPDTNRRFQVVSEWEVLPDFASVNFSEEGAVELAMLLLSRDVGVEAGLSDSNSAEVFVRSGLAPSCLRVLIEPQEQEMAQALETVSAIEKLLNAGSPSPQRLPPLLLHGTEATVWPMMDEAIRRGYAVRVGLEDTLILPDGSLAKNNVELIAEALRRVRK